MAILSSNMTVFALITCFLSATSVNGAVLPRAVVGHNKIASFPQTVPAGSAGVSYVKFQPKLKVSNGCVPFPAVNAAGDTSNGLDKTGLESGGCDKSSGQIYVRSAAVGERTAIMYAWYMPKDSPSSGLGHRHDWESVVVWVNTLEAAGQTLLGAAPSAHGGFSPKKAGAFATEGDRPLIVYSSTWPINHALDFTSVKGGFQPLIAWESLPAVAQTALSNTNFGSANVPFIDKNFLNNLGKAALP